MRPKWVKRESDEGTSVKKVVVIGESVSTDCVSGVMNKNNMENVLGRPVERYRCLTLGKTAAPNF